jgi:hypothetical protein
VYTCSFTMICLGRLLHSRKVLTLRQWRSTHGHSRCSCLLALCKQCSLLREYPVTPQKWFNIGTLAIVVDVLQVGFSPRQRYTLKEFAVSFAVPLFKPNSWLHSRCR